MVQCDVLTLKVPKTKGKLHISNHVVCVNDINVKLATFCCDVI